MLGFLLGSRYLTPIPALKGYSGKPELYMCKRNITRGLSEHGDYLLCLVVYLL